MSRRIKTYHFISWAWVFTATLLMFAPTVLPHHHDGAVVCFCSNPCSHSHGHDHDHSTHTDTDAHCTLNINYYSEDIDREEYVTTDVSSSHDDSHENHLFHMTSCPVSLTDYALYVHEYSPHCLGEDISYHDAPFSSCRALRAPPVFS